MEPHDTPETIDDAELLGWTWLACYCDHASTHIPWRMLRRMTSLRRLVDIAPRLRAKKCGCRPKRVTLYRQTRGEGLFSPGSEEMQVWPPVAPADEPG